MSIEVPSGWNVENVGSNIVMVPGFAFASKDFKDDPNNGLPLIRIRDLFSQKPNKYWKESYDPGYVICNGNFLIGMDGDFEISIWQGGKALLNQRVLKVSSGSQNLNNDFLFYFLKPWLKKIHSETSATTVKHLATKNLKAIKAALPPLPEQKKIAEILGSADAAIAATEAVIEQTKRVKQGLLTDLLTKGIGHTKFKQTKIGQIPESWDVEIVKNLGAKERPSVKAGPFGSALKKEFYSDTGYKIYGQENVIKGSLTYGDYYVDQSIFSKLSSCAIQKDDLLVSLVGTFGKTLLVDGNAENGIINPRLLRLSFNSDIICSKFIQAYFASPLAQKAMLDNSQGGTMGVLNGKIIGKLVVPVPTIEEQQVIVSIVQYVNSFDVVEQSKLEQLKRTKKGLMADLLTGKKRVTV